MPLGTLAPQASAYSIPATPTYMRGPRRDRTAALPLFRRVLYHLSYRT